MTRGYDVNDTPPRLLMAARYAGELFGTTPERRMRKALRDLVKRWARATGKPYGTCPYCTGLTLAGYCLECDYKEENES